MHFQLFELTDGSQDAILDYGTLLSNHFLWLIFILMFILHPMYKVLQGLGGLACACADQVECLISLLWAK